MRIASVASGWRLLALLLSAVAPVGAAGATPLVVQIRGAVASVDNPGFFDGSIHDGARFAATLTLDDAIPDQIPGGNTGRYELDPSNFSLVVRVGSYTGTLTSGMLLIGLDPSQHTLYVNPPIHGDFGIVPAIPGLLSSAVHLSLTDVPGDALHSYAIGDVPFDVGAWNRERHIDISAWAYDSTGDLLGSSVHMQIEQMWVVPEPGTSVLLAIGLSCLGASKGRRRGPRSRAGTSAIPRP